MQGRFGSNGIVGQGLRGSVEVAVGIDETKRASGQVCSEGEELLEGGDGGAWWDLKWCY